MIKIEFCNKKTKPFGDNPKYWNTGYYLCKEERTNELIVVSKVGNSLHFHEGCSLLWSVIDYPTFYENHKLIGKIKDFKISDIKLECD